MALQLKKIGTSTNKITENKKKKQKIYTGGNNEERDLPQLPLGVAKTLDAAAHDDDDDGNNNNRQNNNNK